MFVKTSSKLKSGYAGERTRIDCVVVKVLEGLQTPLHHEVAHSPAGFEWGYPGSGPADLALSILMDILHDRDRAWSLHQQFKFDVIADFSEDTWELSSTQVKTWIASHERRM